MKTMPELLIEELTGIKKDLLTLTFTPGRSIQVDRIDAVIDWLKEVKDERAD